MSLELTDSLPDIAPLPVPSAHVIDQNKSVSVPDEPGLRPDAVNGRKSPTGEAYDPAVHTDPPRIAKRSGTWERQRLGRPKKNGATTKKNVAKNSKHVEPESMALPPGPDPVRSIDAEQVVEPVAPPPDYDQLGELAAGTSFDVLQLTLGQDGSPVDNEQKILAGAYSRYFRAKQVGDIPPGWGLLLVGVGILGRRFAKPTVRSRLEHLYISIRSFINWMKAPIV